MNRYAIYDIALIDSKGWFCSYVEERRWKRKLGEKVG
jgi:hypothetical protein